ncbi:hypothetical protein SAMN02745704_02806 [Paucidesulfovibrio gracilis DSM 16080]|uniref:Uncharacterized protein n=1 Tax=Paucidesulfovibrio gracilis DSM 16080 TaxID=1121449 RepID=A0A1T4Y5N8_9BACT|nr:hypothetical protein SAMN02745704_02806 [Paucidesulfovibrio gracilis DSM 16080]
MPSATRRPAAPWTPVYRSRAARGRGRAAGKSPGSGKAEQRGGAISCCRDFRDGCALPKLAATVRPKANERLRPFFCFGRGGRGR